MAIGGINRRERHAGGLSTLIVKDQHRCRASVNTRRDHAGCFDAGHVEPGRLPGRLPGESGRDGRSCVSRFGARPPRAGLVEGVRRRLHLLWPRRLVADCPGHDAVPAMAGRRAQLNAARHQARLRSRKRRAVVAFPEMAAGDTSVEPGHRKRTRGLKSRVSRSSAPSPRRRRDRHRPAVVFRQHSSPDYLRSSLERVNWVVPAFRQCRHPIDIKASHASVGYHVIEVLLWLESSCAPSPLAP